MKTQKELATEIINDYRKNIIMGKITVKMNEELLKSIPSEKKMEIMSFIAKTTSEINNNQRYIDELKKIK